MRNDEVCDFLEDIARTAKRWAIYCGVVVGLVVFGLGFAVGKWM